MTAHAEALRYREATADNVRTWCECNGIPDPYRILRELQYIADPYNALAPLDMERKTYEISQDISQHITVNRKP